MYAISRVKDGVEQFLCDSPPYPAYSLPQNIWQGLDGTRPVCTDEFLWNITIRREKLDKIYKGQKLKVVKLTEEQCEYLTFRRLKGC